MQDEKGLKEGDSESIKNYVVDYLIKSNFIAALVKKSIFNNLIDNYLDDFISEVWLAILEQSPHIWIELYNTAKEKGTDIEYQARNYFSRVVYNVVKSKSSNAYRKLIKPTLTEKIKDNVQWDVYENTIADENGITDTILNSYE